eukprot:CAMPEP_0206261978 /NCGR_PEP_ID=MMETSP0047_2-20121206/27963_1 /ASSEMBLY_ACC=CAM_ASM_000192 /TAXON_ID=195065 /ORGANISM="Chroomonas mesostigmatica_cf, Strain CCMP1168" /LENGTH=870 /DNA_ID=CAMNT_0053689269 /DNA_START=153 /DNA_END=2762 /DNA_ORIENTATION=-
MASLYEALVGTLSMSQDVRMAAEHRLLELGCGQMFPMSLLCIVLSEDVDMAARQAASITLKNLVLKRWAISENRSAPAREAVDLADLMDNLLSEEDKDPLRSALVSALSKADNFTRPQIVQALKHVIHCDYPQHFPSLLPQIQQGLSTQVPLYEIRAAVTALRTLLRNYLFFSAAQREAQQTVVATCLPPLIPLLEASLTSSVDDNGATEIQKIIIKCVRATVHQELHPILQEEGALTGISDLLCQVLARPVPKGAIPSAEQPDKGTAAEHVVWKCKKNAALVLQRLVRKYGLRGKQEGVGEDVSRVLREQVAPRVLELVLNILKARSQGEFVPDRVCVELCNFVRVCVSVKAAWACLKPFAMSLIEGSLLPMLIFSENDKEIWQDDPQEFIRKENDVMDEFESLHASATGLIRELCWKRATTCLAPTLELCIGVCEKSKCIHPTGYTMRESEMMCAERRHGVMQCVGELPDLISQAGGHERLLWFTRGHVLADMQSKAGHLRYRACWLLGKLAEYLAKDPVVLNEAVSAVLAALQDQDLPVRFQAIVAMGALIFDTASHIPRVQATTALLPVLPQVLDQLFALMDAVGSDELIAALDLLIEAFSEHLAPYAQGLAQRISEHLMRLVGVMRSSAEVDAEEENFEAVFGASQCLCALVTLASSVKSSPELHSMLQANLTPFLVSLLSRGEDSFIGEELIEDAVQLTRALTCTKNLQAVLPLFQPIVQLALVQEEDSVMALASCVPTLKNFISNATPLFLSQKEYSEGILGIVHHVLSEGMDADERDFVDACSLAQDLLLALRWGGCLDAHVPVLLRLVNDLVTCEELGEDCRREALKVHAACLYYNASLTMSSLTAQDIPFSILKLFLDDA